MSSRYSKVPTAATKQQLNLGVCLIWHKRDVNTQPFALGWFTPAYYTLVLVCWVLLCYSGIFLLYFFLLRSYLLNCLKNVIRPSLCYVLPWKGRFLLSPNGRLDFNFWVGGEDIFLLFGAPCILQSDNFSELTAKVICELKDIWSLLQIVHGKPCHLQCQRSVEMPMQTLKTCYSSLAIIQQHTRLVFRTLLDTKPKEQ